MKKFGEFLNESKINHFQIGQMLMLNGLKRKKGNGDEVIVDGPGEIIEISKSGTDIRYTVLVNMKMDYQSPYGEKWSRDTVEWYVLHNRDKDFYKPLD